jgi:hypothetical protein
MANTFEFLLPVRKGNVVKVMQFSGLLSLEFYPLFFSTCFFLRRQFYDAQKCFARGKFAEEKMEISKLTTGSKNDHEVQKRIASEPKRERGGARMESLTLKMVTKVVEKQLQNLECTASRPLSPS